MFNFLKKNKKEEANWIVYKDEIGDHPAILRVDTSYENKKYKHTLAVNIGYDSDNDEKLPDVEQKSFINQIEDMILDKIESDTLNVCFVGTATFNSAAYLIFATNEDVEWKTMIESLLPSPRVVPVIYANDNMGYYNNVLYPKSRR